MAACPDAAGAAIRIPSSPKAATGAIFSKPLLQVPYSKAEDATHFSLLAYPLLPTRPSSIKGSRRRRGERTPRRLLIRRALGFGVAALITLLLAFNGGGYDIVIRQEVGLAIWAAIALGLGVGILPRARLTPAAWAALGGFGALAGLTLLSHTWTRSGQHATEELARVLQYGGLIVLAYLSLNRYTWRGAAMGFATSALVVPFFAVFSRVFPHTFHDTVDALGTDRLSYPLGYWNGVACWGAMALATGLVLSASSSKSLIRAGALAAVPVAALSVYLTYSRFGVAAVAIAVIAALALSKNRWTAAVNGLVAGAGSGVLILVAHNHPEIARATGDAGAGSVIGAGLLVGAACAAVAVVTFRAGLDRVRMEMQSARLALGAGAVIALIAVIGLNGEVSKAWDKFKNDKPPPATGGTARLTSLGSTRYDTWSSAVDAFKSEPLRGIGPGTFEYYWNEHGKNREYLRDAHSLYTEEAAELGLPGMLALLVGLGGLLVAGIQARMRWRRRREIAAGSAVLAAFVVFLAYAGIDWMWELAAIGTLAIGGAAVAGAGGFERASSPGIGPWLRAALVVGALLAGAIQVPGLVSTERVRASQSELAKGHAQKALDLADQAISAEDWASSPYAARAEASARLGDLAGAKRDAQQAVDRQPDDWRGRLLLARIEAELGQAGPARAELAEARRLAPYVPYLIPQSSYMQQFNALLAGKGASAPASAGP
jgi:tetratricopeptide (TPR) repeat protein